LSGTTLLISVFLNFLRRRYHNETYSWTSLYQRFFAASWLFCGRQTICCVVVVYFFVFLSFLSYCSTYGVFLLLTRRGVTESCLPVCSCVLLLYCMSASSIVTVTPQRVCLRVSFCEPTVPFVSALHDAKFPRDFFPAASCDRRHCAVVSVGRTQ